MSLDATPAFVVIGLDSNQFFRADILYPANIMHRFRRNRILARLASLALVGMLLSSIVTALHPGCSPGRMALAALQVRSEVADADCHEHSRADQVDICAQHCGQQDLTRDVVQIPLPPAAPAEAMHAHFAFASIVVKPWKHVSSRPMQSLHRPTTHPADLLLI